MHETNRQSQVSRAVGGRGGKTDGWRLRASGCVDEWPYLRGRHAGAADLAPVLPRVHERHGAVKVAYGACAAGGAALGSLRGRLATVCAVVRHQARHPVSPMKDASSRSVAAAELQWIGLQSSRSSARASVFGHARPCVSSRPAMVFAMAGVLGRRYLARRGSHARRASRHRRDQWRATGCLSGTHLACAQRDARGGTARVRGTVGFGDDAAAARLVTRGEGEKG